MGAQVFSTVGASRKPDSSMKISWATSLWAFFYPLPVLGFPLLDRGLVAFHSPSVRLLVAPPQCMHDSPHMIRMVGNMELFLDQLRYPARGPHFRSPAKGPRPA
jgi:hypothetical protein